MKILGFNYSKVSAEKYKEIDQQLKVNTHIGINEIHRTSVDVIKKGDVLDLEYEFRIVYEPDFAEIFFKGHLVILIDDSKLTERILKEWKNKQVPEDVRIVLMNMLFARCNLKALQLEEDLNLPPHLPPPQITPKLKIQADEDLDPKKKK